MANETNPSDGTAKADNKFEGHTGNITGNTSQSKRVARIHQRALRIAKSMESRSMSRMKDREKGENKSWSSWRREQSSRDCAKGNGDKFSPSLRYRIIRMMIT